MALLKAWKHLALVLVAVFSAGVAHADALTLYFYHSPGLDWSSPKRLGRSAIDNTRSGAAHAIGHVSVEVDCQASGGAYDLFGATTAEGDETEYLIREQGYGLGILFHTFKGRLTSRAEVEAELPAWLASGAMSYARFEVTPEACARLSQYVTEYRAYDYGSLYGLPNRPLFREGAGCTAFGMSFLEVAGLFDPAFERAFSRELFVPPHWVGGPLTGNFVRPIRFFNPVIYSRWAEPDEEHFYIHFYDADLMHDWVRGVYAGTSELPASLPAPTQEWRDQAPGLVFDAKAVALPRGPIFKDGSF